MCLKNKIDFAVVFRVKNANPNGDTLNGNRPRTTFEGLGEMSDVCIKRKIRDSLLEQGQAIFVQSDDRRKDEFVCLRARADSVLAKINSPKEKAAKACETWFDVRAFGQVFAFKASSKGKSKKVEGESEEAGEDKSVSIGIRGPVSVHSAFSIKPISVTSSQITKSVSSEGDGTKKGSDTMGMKHRVDEGIYVFYGSMNPQLAEKTGFSDEDSEKIKEILPKIFENDASSARPEGSMEILKVVWWKHNSKTGDVSSAKVHGSLQVGETGEVICKEIPSCPKPELLNGF